VIIPRIIRDVWLKGEERRGGIFVVLPAESGKIDISHLISFSSVVERMGRTLRSSLRCAGGYGALRSSTHWLGYGEKAGPSLDTTHSLPLFSPFLLPSSKP
jgi:hypothetical protein